MAEKSLHLPRWYLWLAAFLISYGWLSVFYLRFSHNFSLIHRMNIVNLCITFFWIVVNLGMIGWLFLRNLSFFPWEEKIIPFYYFTLNVLNALNIHFRILADFHVLFWIALLTKSFETVVIGKLLHTKN